MNYTWFACEIWGKKAKLDPLSDYFIGMMEVAGLVDVETSSMGLTWSNDRLLQ